MSVYPHPRGYGVVRYPPVAPARWADQLADELVAYRPPPEPPHHWLVTYAPPTPTPTPTPIQEQPMTTVPEAAVPLRLTRAGLAELGSCPQYLRVFAERFPVERFPAGVELTEETCAEHADVFDWSWAAGTFLNYDGRQEHERLVQSRAQVNRRFGTGIHRRAAALGHVFETRPDLRSDVAVTAMTNGEERQDAQLLREVEAARTALAHAVRERDDWTRRVPERQARLAELERLAAGAQRRLAERQAERAALAVRRAEDALVGLRDAARAASAALEALSPEAAPEPAEAPTTEPARDDLAVAS